MRARWLALIGVGALTLRVLLVSSTGAFQDPHALTRDAHTSP